MSRKFITVAAVGACILAAPVMAQKAKDTLRIAFYDPIPGVDIIYDPKEN